MNPKKLMMEGATPVASQLYVDDVFSAYTYTGTASGAIVNNGLDLASGGMVWVKSRSDTNTHYVCDSERVGKSLSTNNTSAEGNSTGLVLNSAGFTASGSAAWGGNGINYASWSFKKAPKFFDIVTYTGDGVNGRQVSHNLEVEPGMVVVKRLDMASTYGWPVWHRGFTPTYPMGLLNSVSAFATAPNHYQGYVSFATNSVFRLNSFGSNMGDVNALGATYIAYVFAHDDSATGLIQCGSYTGNGSATGPIVTLGWEPQYLLIKNASGTGNWHILDSMRGMPVSYADYSLQANLSDIESNVEYVSPTARGFQVTSTSAEVNTSGSTYIYMAIRRSNKPPQSGSEVLSLTTATGNGTNTTITTGLQTDSLLVKSRNNTGIPGTWSSRLSGDKHLVLSTTASEASSYLQTKAWDVMDGVKVQSSLNSNSSTYVYYAFKRASGFFDTVCYTGTGVARTVEHGLGAVPELMIVKSRSSAGSWIVRAAPLTIEEHLTLVSNSAKISGLGDVLWNSAIPTTSVFSLGDNPHVNSSNITYIAYLFASLPGISKVGSYTGNGTSQTIDCGFTTGARFVLIKRTDNTGDWYVWDSARGIVAANDPHLSLNTTAVEVTTDDSVDPATVGFVVNQVTATNINVSAGQYIYLAIA